MENFRKPLEGSIGRKQIDRVVAQVTDSPALFPALYALTTDEDTRMAWHATWACEKLSILLPSLYIGKEKELRLHAMQCNHGGRRRLLLNILLHLPVEEPVDVAFLDFCLHRMLSPSEPAGGQALCMKLAYARCRKEPALRNELQAYLENMEPECYTAAVQCTRNRMLKDIRKEKL